MKGGTPAMDNKVVVARNKKNWFDFRSVNELIVAFRELTNWNKTQKRMSKETL